MQAGAITAAVTGSDFLISNAGRVKVNLPEPQGPRLFHGESQDPRCATPRTNARYRARGGEENSAHRNNQP